MIGAGAAWALWAAVTLHRAGTPLTRTARPRVLVEEGPYRLGRHPHYLGALLGATGLAATGPAATGLAATGLAVLLAALASLLTALAMASPTALALLLVARVLIPTKQRHPAQVFGGGYRDCAGSARRWLKGGASLLLLLARQPQRVFTRDEILNRLRGRDADRYPRAVDLLVSRLRRKLKPLACIKTLRNAGYTLALGPAG